MTDICSIFFFIIASYFKGQMDYILFKKNNPQWKKKWKLTPAGKLIPYEKKDWYYFGIYPKFKESFPYSSTLLVFFTDKWHFYQFVFLRCFYLALGFQLFVWYIAIISALVLFPLLYGAAFYFAYERKTKR